MFDTLQNKCLNVPNCINKVNEFYNALQKIRDKDFDLAWTEVTSNAEYEDKQYEQRPTRQSHDDRLKWQHIFKEILDTLMPRSNWELNS